MRTRSKLLEEANIMLVIPIPLDKVRGVPQLPFPMLGEELS
jgi:hypothetical protein